MVRGLRKKIENREILSFDDRDKKVVQITEKDVNNIRIERVWRRAKNIIFDLENDTALIFHLKMTGQLIWEKCEGEGDFCLRNRRGGGHPDSAWLEKLPNKHTRAIFYFDDESVLYFNDIRRFGWIKVIQRSKIKDQNYGPLFNNIGVEPLEGELTPEYLAEMAERFSNRKIKQFIMDQSIIAGVGNIYADESLYVAKIAPMRLAKDIKNSEWLKLIKSIREVLEQGIKYGGSSSENFVDAFGKQGEAHEHLLVYRRTGKKCPNNCGGVIERTVIGGRGTHWCPKCQK
ncbi:MAG: Formamidopyrimidine-DNA glycosylase [bacterium ADurb.Bin212]|nr:MAG: Formamidopyrimidine-DNA glycosylase [bacterium ADurb.Bin212]